MNIQHDSNWKWEIKKSYLILQVSNLSAEMVKVLNSATITVSVSVYIKILSPTANTIKAPVEDCECMY